MYMYMYMYTMYCIEYMYVSRERSVVGLNPTAAHYSLKKVILVVVVLCCLVLF